MILKTRLTERSRENIERIKKQNFSAEDRITAGYIMGMAVEETAELPEEMWKEAANRLLDKGPARTSPGVSTSLSLRQSVYEQLCRAQERVGELCGREVYMSQVIDLVLVMAAESVCADCGPRVDSLAVMEWNINGRSGSAPLGHCIPVNLIANEVLEKNPDIFVLTEFVPTAGWLDLKAILSRQYELFTSPYRPRQNGICIGVRKRGDITCLGERTLDFPAGPDFHEVRVRVNGKELSVIGTRVQIDLKAADRRNDDRVRHSEQMQRFEQFQRLSAYIATLDNVVVVGDFNNSRIRGDENETDTKRVGDIYRELDSLYYNYQKIRATVERDTAGRCSLCTAVDGLASVGAQWGRADKGKAYRALPPKEGRSKYDHIIANAQWEVRAEYHWDFLDAYDEAQFEKGKIRAGFPDHAVLLATVRFGTQSAE